MVLNLEIFFEKSYNLALFREHFHQYFEMVFHAKLLNLKTFKDIWKASIFFKDLNKNCGMMSLFLKTFHGLHIFKDF